MFSCWVQQQVAIILLPRKKYKNNKLQSSPRDGCGPGLYHNMQSKCSYSSIVVSVFMFDLLPNGTFDAKTFTLTL